MSNEERARILRMVAEGKVTPAEAEDLLAALDAAPDAGARSTGSSATFGPGSMPAPLVPPAPPRNKAPRRSLVIQVKEMSREVGGMKNLKMLTGAMGARIAGHRWTLAELLAASK